MVEIQNLELIVSIIAGFATAAAVIFLGYETLKLRDERNNTLRAWLGQGQAHVFVDGHFNKDEKFIPQGKWVNLTQDQKDEFGVTQTRRYIDVKNYGQIPATNVKVRTKFVVGKVPNRKNIETESFSTPAIIMPNEVQKLFFVLEREEEDSIEDNSKDCYLIYEIEFESPKKKKRKFGRIDSISIQRYGIIDNWDENG